MRAPSSPPSLVISLPHMPYCIKYGTGVQLAEAAALRLVAEKTSVPVPKVHCAFRKGKLTYIVMEKIEGEEIGKDWATRPANERESLLRELKEYFEQLRNIQHPQPGTITAADGQSLYDHRVLNGNLGFGPFLTEKDFNLFLRDGVTPNSSLLDEAKSVLEPEERIALKKLVDMHEEKSHSICFTHGDASSSNVLVRNGSVAALIDFELSGFYPEYWEYTTAMKVNSSDGFWKQEVGNFLAPYPREWEMEQLRLKFFGRDGMAW
jgi:aminoglycoside phosphotransferase